MDETAKLATLVRSVAHSLIVVANNSLGDESSEVVVVVPADTFDRNGDVGSVKSVIAYSDIGSDKLGLFLGQKVGVSLGGGLGQLGEVLVGHLDELLVGDATGTDEDHAVGGVVVLDVVGELSSGDVADVLLGTEDGAAQRLMLEGGGMQMVKDNLLDLLFNLLRLAQNNVTFPFDSGRLELGVLEDIGKNVDALWHVLVQGLGKVDCILALFQKSDAENLGRGILGDVTTYRSVGIQVSAHVLDFELQLLLCPAGRTL